MACEVCFDNFYEQVSETSTGNELARITIVLCSFPFISKKH